MKYSGKKLDTGILLNLSCKLLAPLLIILLIEGCPDSGTSGPDWQAVQKFGEFGNGPLQFNEPRGLRVEFLLETHGMVLFIADYGNDRIQIYSIENDSVLIFGEKGTDFGQFNGPAAIAVTRVNPFDSPPPKDSLYLYVADSKNHRIQKFDINGNFLTSWGEFGSDTGQFNIPIGIDIDFGENVYVVDSGNNRIQVFDSVGNFKSMWGSYGEGDGQFKSPMDIGIITDLDYETLIGLAVSDYGNSRVQFFYVNGDFARSFNIPNPIGISGGAPGFAAVGSNKRYYSYYLPSNELTSQSIGEMNYPFDYDGSFYFTDRDGHQIYKYRFTYTY